MINKNGFKNYNYFCIAWCHFWNDCPTPRMVLGAQ